jgi:hypothetical protein
MAVTVASIDAAINKILTYGQAATIDGIVYQLGNIGELWEMRKDAQKEAQNTSKTRPVFRAFNLGTMGYSSTGDGVTPVPTTPNLP